MDIIVKSVINIFTIIDGKINLLVDKNNKLIEVICLDNLDTVSNNYIKDNIDIKNLNLRQCYTFSEKVENKYIVTVLYSDIINVKDIKLNDNYKFTDIDLINNIYISKSMEWLKKELVLSSCIVKLYPSEFVLPEIQKIYEKVLNKKYDRRNFRKKLIKLDIIEDLNKFSKITNGRPAKLYKFKKLQEDKILF